MQSLKSKVKKALYESFPANFKLFVAQESYARHEHLEFQNTSFSQEGEDIILSHLFYGKTDGFYLDIGAHKPIQYSNTYKFYLLGWRGINIDAMPGSMDAFNKVRPEDINLEVALSNKDEILPYYMFNAAGTNTFSEKHAEDMLKQGGTLLATKNIKTVKLQEMLAKHLPGHQLIDFLSLDVEGIELEVLLSNDWSKYRPTVLLVESLHLKNKDVLQQYLNQYNYQLIAQTVHNLYFRDITTIQS